MAGAILCSGQKAAKRGRSVRPLAEVGGSHGGRGGRWPGAAALTGIAHAMSRAWRQPCAAGRAQPGCPQQSVGSGQDQSGRSASVHNHDAAAACGIWKQHRCRRCCRLQARCRRRCMRQFGARPMRHTPTALLQSSDGGHLKWRYAWGTAASMRWHARRLALPRRFSGSASKQSIGIAGTPAQVPTLQQSPAQAAFKAEVVSLTAPLALAVAATTCCHCMRCKGRRRRARSRSARWTQSGRA